jgi:hypothetical protein
LTTPTQYLRDPLKRIVSETTTTGARVVTRTYDYTPSTDPQTLGLPATKVTTTATGVDGSIVQTTVSDFLGRTISSTSPGPMGTPETTIFVSRSRRNVRIDTVM